MKSLFLKLRKYSTLCFLLCLIHSLAGCSKGDDDVNTVYKDHMRELVINISQYCKTRHPGFIIIPQNGQELITTDGDESSGIHEAYVAAIDGQGREDLFFGYEADDLPTPIADQQYMSAYLNKMTAAGKPVLVTDYCSTAAHMQQSYTANQQLGYLSFAADHRGLDHIPAYPVALPGENARVITQLKEAANFLYLIDPSNYTKIQFIAAVTNTNYDVVIIDAFKENEVWTAAEIAQLRRKKNGGQRLVIAYMSIGEAENYRYYWQSTWQTGNPDWLKAENPDWPGNYKVKYWQPEWQSVIYGNDSSYASRILNAGFDGAYLDLIDAFEYFE